MKPDTSTEDGTKKRMKGKGKTRGSDPATHDFTPKSIFQQGLGWKQLVRGGVAGLADLAHLRVVSLIFFLSLQRYSPYIQGGQTFHFQQEWMVHCAVAVLYGASQIRPEHPPIGFRAGWQSVPPRFFAYVLVHVSGSDVYLAVSNGQPGL